MEAMINDGHASLSQQRNVNSDQWLSRYHQRLSNPLYAQTRVELGYNLAKPTTFGNTSPEYSYEQRKEHQRSVYNSQRDAALMIEWDCLDSFHDFAIYMEKSNPICPAEHLDTPEKLIKLLGW